MKPSFNPSQSLSISPQVSLYTSNPYPPIYRTSTGTSRRPTLTTRPPSGPRLESHADKRQKTLFGNIGCTKRKREEGDGPSRELRTRLEGA
eukprot:scaffold57533_cov22-Tisochrysis_lutea.AAC.1